MVGSVLENLGMIKMSVVGSLLLPSSCPALPAARDGAGKAQEALGSWQVAASTGCGWSPAMLGG